MLFLLSDCRRERYPLHYRELQYLFAIHLIHKNNMRKKYDIEGGPNTGILLIHVILVLIDFFYSKYWLSLYAYTTLRNIANLFP